MSYRRCLLAFVATAAVTMAAGMATAQENYPPPEIERFVGKGEVKELFGWNNHQLQDEAVDLHAFNFLWNRRETTWSCIHSDTGAGYRNYSIWYSTLVGPVRLEPRMKGAKGTGFNLQGYLPGYPLVRGYPDKYFGEIRPFVCPAGYEVGEGEVTVEDTTRDNTYINGYQLGSSPAVLAPHKQIAYTVLNVLGEWETPVVVEDESGSLTIDTWGYRLSEDFQQEFTEHWHHLFPDAAVTFDYDCSYRPDLCPVHH